MQSNVSSLKKENGITIVLDQVKADLLSNVFANIRKNLAKNFSTAAIENDTSFINRAAPGSNECPKSPGCHFKAIQSHGS